MTSCWRHRWGVGPLGMLSEPYLDLLHPSEMRRDTGGSGGDSHGKSQESLWDLVESNHAVRDAWGSTEPMPPRSPLGRFVPAGRPLPEEADRNTGVCPGSFYRFVSKTPGGAGTHDSKTPGGAGRHAHTGNRETDNSTASHRRSLQPNRLTDARARARHDPDNHHVITAR